MNETVAILGAGKMGEALLSGLLRSGRAPGELLFTERHPERSAILESRYDVRGVTTAQAAQTADTLLIAVKPQEMTALLDELGPQSRPATSSSRSRPESRHRSSRNGSPTAFRSCAS